jgi:hypothetical protein
MKISTKVQAGARSGCGTPIPLPPPPRNPGDFPIQEV